MSLFNMDFNADKPIYLQIADYICEQILLKYWQSHEKIPSIRELAANLSVNANTVVRSYAWLEEMKVITMQRGLGYFVVENSVECIRDLKKQIFFHDDLPQLFRQMDLLDVNIKQINELYKKRKKNEKK